MTDESGNRTIAGLLPIIRKVMIHMTWLVTGPHTIYMYIRGADPDTLGLTMWTPFDIRPSPLHEIVIAIQAYSTTYTLSNFLGYMGLYSTLATIACIQMEKLHQRLRNYRREEVTKPGTEEDYLREQIQYHQDILSFIRAIDDTFSMMMLGHFLMIIGALCFASISFVTIWHKVGDLLQTIFILSSFVIMLGIFCWFGDQLNERAINVKQAIWDSGWIGAPIRQQRNIVFMMVAANEDFALSAGGFAPVSLRTMIVVLNQAVSYTMFMMNVKDADRDESAQLAPN
ncbi:odorant receptor 49b [Cryptotermes secundus]|uniref:odorant receptor 49b n=1 Tax=Cryptotermes secundus TaxID=105785 RepID=UPI000CD7AE94|nr:odorant receptor 49b [Cryptotermes secundus]